MNAIPAAIEKFLHAAQSARQSGDREGERRTLEEALSRHDDSPHLWNARAMRALADGDYDLAVTAFDRAILLDPSEPTLRVNLATAHRHRGDDDGEAAALESVLALDARHFIAQLRSAELRQRQGRLSEASRHWSAVVQMGEGIENPPPLVTEAVVRGRALLAQHNEAFGRTLDEAIGALPSGDRRSQRFTACVDAMLGRRRIYRNECAGLHYPFLPADEFFDRTHFAWFGELEGRAPAIRDEALAILRDRSDDIRPYVRQAAGTPANKWSALDNRLDWGACFLWEYGTRNDAVCDRCPATSAALDAVPQSRVPGKAPNAFFSILQPGAHIPPHTGVTNTRAIVHLPLVVPDGCGFRVGGETRVWEEGVAFAFDDTIEHEAWNKGGEQRIVLIFDVWNPYLSLLEQEYLTTLFDVADRGIVSTDRG